MGILDDMAALVDEFNAYPEWEARYRRIIALGRALPAMDEALKTEENRVRGCASTVWLHAAAVPDAAGGAPRIAFQADSDAILVRGLVALLLQVYNHRTAREILGAPPDFLEDLGLNVNLSQNRANGLTAMASRIREYAQSFQAA
jgi:cysteine desulfuration protein SufE